MKDPRDPRNQEPESFFCKCSKCKGDSVGYEFNDMLDPFGDCISLWCANLKTLEQFLNEGPVITNAEYELQWLGITPFFLKYYQAPLEPFTKPGRVNDLFDEIAEMEKTEINQIHKS